MDEIGEITTDQNILFYDGSPFPFVVLPFLPLSDCISMS
ncbi:MAG: hypothetical protein ACI9S8_001452 [Chlamydiales bacterium]|jgi:hypothetical protein